MIVVKILKLLTPYLSHKKNQMNFGIHSVWFKRKFDAYILFGKYFIVNLFY